MKIAIYNVVSISLVLLGSPAICASDAELSPKNIARTPKTTLDKVSKTPIKHLNGMVSTAKTGMGVRVFYEFSNAVIEGNEAVTLKIIRVGSGDPATIELKPDTAIVIETGLPSSKSVFNTGDQYTVKLKPAQQGLHYIGVFLQSGSASEALAIPVQIGKSANLTKSGTVTTTPTGRRVVSTPAQ